MKLSTRTHGRQSVGIGCKEEIRAARKGRGTLQVAELGLLDESILVLGSRNAKQTGLGRWVVPSSPVGARHVPSAATAATVGPVCCHHHRPPHCQGRIR